MVNKMLKDSGAIEGDTEEQESQEDGEGSSEEWGGFPDRPDLELVDHEEEYIDEDRYTTVTVESVSISRDGFEKPVIRTESEDDEEKGAEKSKDDEDASKSKAAEKSRPKKKKQKFRYESKFDRQLTDRKQRAKSKRR